MLGSIIVSANSGDTEKIIEALSGELYANSAAKLIAFTLSYKNEKPKMVASVREILKQNGFSTNMLGIINFVTNYDLLMEMIGKKPDVVISILKMKHVSNNLIDFLKKHMELFDLLVAVSKKMRKVNPLKYSGDDLKAENTAIIINQNIIFSRRTISYMVFAVLIFVVYVFFVLLFQ